MMMTPEASDLVLVTAQIAQVIGILLAIALLHRYQ